MYRIGEHPSEFLIRKKREVLDTVTTIENYEREHKKFANFENTIKIKEYATKLVAFLEDEIGTAMRYEQWLDDGIEKVFVIFGKRISPKGNITKYRWIKAFKSKRKAENFKDTLKKDTQYTEFELKEVELE